MKKFIGLILAVGIIIAMCVTLSACDKTKVEETKDVIDNIVNNPIPTQRMPNATEWAYVDLTPTSITFPKGLTLATQISVKSDKARAIQIIFNNDNINNFEALCANVFTFAKYGDDGVKFEEVSQAVMYMGGLSTFTACYTVNERVYNVVIVNQFTEQNADGTYSSGALTFSIGWEKVEAEA